MATLRRPRGRLPAVGAHSSLVAVALSVVGGWVDSIGFVVLAGIFVAHQSGNTTHVAVSLGEGDWADVARHGAVVVEFVLGTAVGVAVLEAPGRRRSRTVPGLLLLEGALLVVFAFGAARAGSSVDLTVRGPASFVLGAAITMAMGVQNALLRRIDSQAVHTTFITGMLTAVAVALARLVILQRSTARAGLPAAVYIAYLIGGAGGALTLHRLGLGTLAVPVVALLSLAFLPWERVDAVAASEPPGAAPAP